MNLTIKFNNMVFKDQLKPHFVSVANSKLFSFVSKQLQTKNISGQILGDTRIDDKPLQKKILSELNNGELQHENMSLSYSVGDFGRFIWNKYSRDDEQGIYRSVEYNNKYYVLPNENLWDLKELVKYFNLNRNSPDKEIELRKFIEIAGLFKSFLKIDELSLAIQESITQPVEINSNGDLISYGKIDLDIFESRQGDAFKDN